MKILSIAQVVELFGKPGDDTNFVIMNFPFPMKLDWDLKTKVTKTIVHKLAKPAFEKSFKDLKLYYGETRIDELGINQFGGCFNHRPMRGTEVRYANAIARKDYATAMKYLSKHSWAIAMDLDPNRNLLRETKRTARFARKEYAPMIDIFYSNGILGYGPEKDYDWMHWEIGDLKRVQVCL